MSTTSQRGLLTVLGVTFGLAVTVGNVIGAGILRTPGSIAEHLPSLPLYFSVWVIGGLYALLGANALAELGAMLPRSGGQYVFVRHALGDYPGFVVGWSDWISTCGTTAVVSIVIGEYAVGLFPSLRSPGGVALGLILVLTAIQAVGVMWGSATQNVTSALKALALVVLSVACLIFGEQSFTSPATVSTLALPVAFILSLQAVIYTYDGWTASIYFSEEVRDPGRAIPRAMFGGLLSVMAIYLLLNVAFVRVVPLSTIAGTDLAAAVVAQRLAGDAGDTLIRGLMIVALLSALNSNVMMAPRVTYAMATDRLFWKGATSVNAGGTPLFGLIASSAIAAAFVASGTFEKVVAKLAFFFVLQYTLSFTSFFVLRVREPERERPFRAWGHPITTGLALLASIAFLVGAVVSDTTNSIHSMVMLAISFPVFLLFQRVKRS